MKTRAVDDPKLVGTSVSDVEEAATLVKRRENQLVVALPASDNFPPVVEQVTPVVRQVMEKTKKRSRPIKSLTPKSHRPPKMMKEEEEVCFICFDGGSIVLCDRKGCPKAYHPACIKRDEAFFKSTAKWDCGWHICSVCQKAAHYMCYTCTYSLCKKCTMDADYVCVRGNKGFCAICMKTIMMIENIDAGNKELIQVDFDDKTSWEYLFKMYWVLLKNKLSLSLNELIQAKNPCRGVIGSDFKHQIPEKDNSVEGVAVPILPNSNEHSELKTLQEHQLPDHSSLSTEKPSSDKRKNSNGCADWGSSELLEFVAHMKNGDTSLLSQFDVQALLMEYIKKNNLRDPRQKSQIICDLRLKMLFGKQRVGHIEMLKLLEYHFIIKEDTPKNAFIPAGIVGCASHVGDDHYNHSVLTPSKKQRTRKKGERSPQVNLDEYAAIDAHNINLIFLRRCVMENLVDEEEKFHDKVVGSVVRIRVSCNDQNQDFYRLVRVVGTNKGAEPYKIGDKTTDIMLEVLNLDKKETMSIDAISNQVFSEDECRRLRQSIKCGIVKPLTVGEIQIKAMALQALRFDDWLVAEILRLSHLRDRANEKGHKKEHRECVEKLKVLKTPEVRHQKLTEIPEVHADPKMNPNYKSEDDTGENDKKKDEASKLGHSKLGTSGNHISGPKKSVKENEAIGAQRVLRKRDGGGSNIFPKQENHDSPAVSSSVFGNQFVLRSESETATVASVSRIALPTSDIEMEKIWHYRDPNGKIQGPFSMVQLQKWSTTGYFPANMRIWTDNEQDHSIPLNDALGGDSWRKFCSETRSNAAREGLDSHTCDVGPHDLDKEKQSGAVQCSDLLKNVPAYSERPIVHNNNIEQTYVDPLHQVTKHSAEEFSNASVNEHPYEVPLHRSPGIESKEKSSVNQNHVSQSSGPIRAPALLNLDLNNRDCNPSSLINPSESSEVKIDLDIVNLPSHAPGTSNMNSKSQPKDQDSMIQAAELLRSLSGHVPANSTRASDVQRPVKHELNEDLPSPTPKPSDDGDLRNPEQKPSDENLLGQSDGDLRNPERKPSDENRLGQSDGPCDISVKELGCSSTSSQMVGGAEMQPTAGVWVGSPSCDEPSCKEWDFGLVPMSSLQPSDAVGDEVATTTSNGNHHSLPSHPLPDLSSWPAGINEPIEFNTLAEESVSDLLAEVDAMESQSGMPSPSSAMRCGDDLIDRNDCFSSIEELSPTPDAGKSDAVSSNPEIQLPSQPTEIVYPVGVSQVDALDPLKRPAGHSTTSSEGETKAAGYPINIWEPGPDIHPPAPCTLNQGMVNATNHGWATVQENMNLGWVGHPQGFPNVGWRPSLGTTWVDSNLSLGAYNGNGWDSPHRFGGSRDWSVQGGDLGFGRGRPMWSRQQHGCGGGHSRPSPRGQRVCKFYESGHCKKGAACGYLHP